MLETFNRVVDLIGVSSKDKSVKKLNFLAIACLPARQARSFSFLFLFFCSVAAFGSDKNISIASDITPDNVVTLTNKSRADSGHSLLSVNAKLSAAALAKAEDMVANNYFSHTSPAGLTPWNWIDKANYDYNFAGENLAMDFHTAEKMEDAWIESPTHRANILSDKYKEIGAAVKEGMVSGHNTKIVVVMFGSGDKSQPVKASGSRSNPKAARDDIPNKISNFIPALPAGEVAKKIAYLQDPVITSPQSGEIFSASETRIIGRARPGMRVSIFDNGNFVEAAIADSDGWFGLKEKSLSQGSHRLSIRTNTALVETGTEFFVDQEKPGINFRLYSDKNNPKQMYLEATTNKNNCLVRFSGEERRVSRSKTVFAVEAKIVSSILRVTDVAGNRNFKQVNMANYYAPDRINNISEKITKVILPQENIYAAISGREAIGNNLGITSQKLTMQIDEKNNH